MAALPGIVTSPEVRYLLGAILILTGLALAFWGHGLWATVMSLIGALLGSVVGFLFGVALGSDLTGLILAIVGAVIGSILFTKLVKVALAFLVGLLAGAAIYALLGGKAQFTAGQLDTPLIAAILVLVVVFGISYYFIDDIIGIITAAIGGLLLALGLYLLQVVPTTTAALAGLGVFVLGAFMQTSAIRRKRQARAAADRERDLVAGSCDASDAGHDPRACDRQSASRVCGRGALSRRRRPVRLPIRPGGRQHSRLARRGHTTPARWLDSHPARDCMV